MAVQLTPLSLYDPEFYDNLDKKHPNDPKLKDYMPVVGTKVFKALDKNHDNKLTKDEIDLASKEVPDLKDFIEKNDRDKDGAVTLPELSRKGFAFSELDKDHDGKLSKSTATDLDGVGRRFDQAARWAVEDLPQGS